MGKLTTSKAIRKHCKICATSPSLISDCGGDKPIGTKKPCPFFKYRSGKGNGKPKISVIRRFCVDCMGGSSALVRACPSELSCILYPFRLGKHPNYVVSEERLEFLKKNINNANNLKIK